MLASFLLLLGAFPVFSQFDTTYYKDQKTNCSSPAVAGSFCYQQNRVDEWGQIKSCSVPGSIALTFDDGPAVGTPQILDILKKYSMKATFFIKGVNIEGKVPILQRIVNEGHQIACHTQTHPNLALLTSSQIREEILGFERTLIGYNIAGVVRGKLPNYMRAPFGSVDAEVMQVISQLGYKSIHWGILTADSREATTADIIYKTYLSHMGGPEGKGVLPSRLTLIAQQHDTQPATVASFAKVAQYLKTKFVGARFVTVAECMGNSPAPYRPNNRIFPDPTCANGIKGNTGTCCSKACGRCGGDNCSGLPGGSSACCETNILTSGLKCSMTSAPCKL